MVRPAGIAIACVLCSVACVAAPQAQRSGGQACRTDGECNAGPQCGPVHLCVDGYCAEETIFRVCTDGGYPEVGVAVGQCLTYLNCNATGCGSLVPCVNSQCDTTAQPLYIDCDGGVPDASFGD